VHQWFGFLSFDVMGDFAFATSFGMLKNGKWDEGVKLVRDGMNILGPISPVPWLAQIGFMIPGAAKTWKQMLQWCTETMKRRLEVSGRDSGMMFCANSVLSGGGGGIGRMVPRKRWVI
jgi:tryprostatin B 6-hydroxylase